MRLESDWKDTLDGVTEVTFEIMTLDLRFK